MGSYFAWKARCDLAQALPFHKVPMISMFLWRRCRCQLRPDFMLLVSWHSRVSFAGNHALAFLVDNPILLPRRDLVSVLSFQRTF